MEATTLTVNVELILDSSGSMAEAIPGTENQSRMEAAKAALRDVIGRIPACEGRNVGFRVFGHAGSNGEADRAVSCRSTELLVPIDGVAKERLPAEVEAVVRAEGEIVASGGDQGPQPFVVEDGGLAIGYVSFSGADFPDDAEFAFDQDADPVGANEFNSNRDLIVEEVNGTEDSVVGILSNPHDERIVGALIMALACFDDSGRLLDFIQSATTNDELEPGDTKAFAVTTVLDVEACPIFLVAGYGSAA